MSRMNPEVPRITQASGRLRSSCVMCSLFYCKEIKVMTLVVHIWRWARRLTGKRSRG